MSPDSPQRLRSTLIVLGVACGYFLTGRLGTRIPFIGTTITLIWPAAGVAFAAVSRFGLPAVIGVMLGGLLVSLSIGGDLVACLPVAVGSALPAVIACRLLGDRCKANLFSDPTSLSYFLAIAVLLAPTASATIGTLVLWVNGHALMQEIPYAWLVWWAGDAIGVLVVAPALLTWTHAPTLSRAPMKWLEFGALCLGFAILAWLLFFSFDSLQVTPLSFAILPLFVWTALRFPPVVLTQALLALATIAMIATAAGRGPFVLEGSHKSLVFLHSFLTAVASVGLILSASVNAFRQSLKDANATADRMARQQGGMLSLIDEQLLFQPNLDGALRQVTETAAHAVAVHRVGFWSLEDGGSRLVSVDCYDAARGVHESGTVLKRADFPSYFRAIQDTRMVAADQAMTHPNTREFTDAYLAPLGIGSMLDVPVRLFGNLLGVLCFEHVGSPRVWRDDECFFALSMANLVAAAHEHDQRRRAEASLQLAVTAFETSEGIMITDAHANILRVNQAACAITGYKAEELVGNNTRILHSDRHDHEFYQAMWATLMEEGHWEGELWTRRREGDNYPQWISTNVVRGQDGAISHFVSTFIDISERKRSEEEIARLAHFDSLTGLPNRRLIMDRLHQCFLAAQRAKRFGILMFVDLDHFKHLNDALGHAAGDDLLVQVADRLRGLGRQTDSVGRLGGDEFLILLDSLCESVDAAVIDARLVADKILAEMRRPIELAGQFYQVGASIGVSVFPDGCRTPADVLRQADTAMYRAKASSRNTVRFFESEMQEAAEKRLDIERALREALRQGEMEIHLQPQIAPDGRRHAAEVLARWHRPGQGWIPPDVFIPIAEESGLICELGDWVLDQACRAIHTLATRASDCDIAVNVSPRQFRQADFTDRVREILTRTGAQGSRLILELTEHALIDDANDAVAKMNDLSQLGVRFAIDDFGAGYSALTYLRRLPVSEIKIDRSFIHDVISDPNDAAIVDAILAMAERLGLKVVAEGVESLEQLKFLETHGCRYFQGFYYSHPLPWDAFLEQQCADEKSMRAG